MRAVGILFAAVALLPSGARAQAMLSLGVTETGHAVGARFEGGVALVSERLSFDRGMLRYGMVTVPLAIPRDAVGVMARMCDATGCKELTPVPAGLGALVYLPESVAARFVVHARWAAPLAIEDGVARVVVPGNDRGERVPLDVSLDAPGHGELHIGGHAANRMAGLAPGSPVELRAELPAGTAVHVHRATCGGRACGRVAVSAGRRDAVPVRAVLALPLSPSSVEVTEERIRRGAELVRASLPAGSELRVLTFGHGAPALGPWTDAAELDVASFALPILAFEVEEPLEQALALASGEVESIIVLSGPDEVWDANALSARARRAGLRVSLVNIADAPLSSRSVGFARRSGGVAVELGDLARPTLAPRTSQAGEVARRLAALSAPIVEHAVAVRLGDRIVSLGDLRAGEQLVWEGIGDPVVLVSGVTRAVAAPTPHARAAIAERLRVALTTPRTSTARGTGTLRVRHARPPIIRCGGGCRFVVRGATSREVIARAFRRTARPAVRACFQRARAGRPSLALRVVVTVAFQRGEPVTVDATGGGAPLDACVADAARQVRLPELEETLVVRYPFVASAAPEPPRTAIGDELRDQLHAVFGEPTAATP